MRDNYLQNKELLNIIEEELNKQRTKSIPFFLLLCLPGMGVTWFLMWFVWTLALVHPAYGFLFFLVIFALIGYLFLILRISMIRTIKNWDHTETDKKIDDWAKKWDITEEK